MVEIRRGDDYVGKVFGLANLNADSLAVSRENLGYGGAGVDLNTVCFGK